ncbi:nucleotidyltransferase family protein [Undibacterium sp. CY7W]|uniref:Nucleotidyltransferase family protein n=1 Tax=Undibacterium rugosum TaxID=2762291 RepID=A0A923I275_9BURK|nr:nucleotidyltransferase family protein [Undibacterium rugosum]MBC3936331.1 nucleotidyltransferase family protein [Undibacterium rugosum]
MTESAAWTGILLAAGRGRRFDPAGQQSKLLIPWGEYPSVAVACATRLLQAFPFSIAVLRPDQQELQRQLADAGCAIVLTEQADLGMAHSLRAALMQTQHSAGWLVALADMPCVTVESLLAIRDAALAGHRIVVPEHQGQRGNPVAFAASCLPDLLQLQGDQGARGLLHSESVYRLTLDDAGICQDIDTQDDWLHLRHNGDI